MNSDEQFREKLDKSVIIELLKKNVTLFSYTRILKMRVFTRLFFYLFKNKSNEQSNE